MSVRVVCPHCKKPQNFDDSLAGTATPCDSCGELVQVPLTEEAKSGRRKSGGVPLWANVAAGIGGVVLIAAIVWLLLGAFRSSVTMENFQKLKEGMTEAEVQSILGAPNRGKKTMTSQIPGREKADYWVWTDGPKTITVIFVDGKAVEVSGNLQPTPVPQQ